MRNDKLRDELSAYLDGEARDPDRIQRLLQEDPEAAVRHAQMAKLSQHLKALPEPEVRPEFLTRVMAHVREQEVTPRRPVWIQFGLPVAAFAMLALVAGVIALSGNEAIAPVEDNVALVSNPMPTFADVDLTDDEVVVTQLAAMFARGEIETEALGYYFTEGEVEGEEVEGYDTVWTILDDTSWEDSYADYTDTESDWYADMLEATDDEWEILDEVVTEYVNEELS